MKLLITGLAVALAGASFAQVFAFDGQLEEHTINLTGSATSRDVPTIVYQGTAGNPSYSAFANATGVIGFDDYTAAWTGPFTLDAMKFVGNVGTANTGLNISFFDSSSAFVGGFNVNLPTTSASIWNITGLAGLNLVLPDTGFIQLSTVSTNTGRWFLTSAAPLIGANSTTVGGANGGALRHAFELTAVPEPTSMAALGLGAVAMLRRRRAKK